MMNNIDKRDRAALLRQRLREALEMSGLNQTSLARAVGVDRSTISQILSGDGARMPNAQLVAEAAAALGVSADWLLGLTDRPELSAELLAASVLMTAAPRALVDEQILTWHQEAAGYKICHVPTSIPDILKTHAVMRWEYSPQLGRTIDQAIGAAEDKLSLMRQTTADMEIAMPMQELTAFAEGSGYYRGLDPAQRLDQLDHLAAMHDQFYPKLRIYLFDAKKIYSSPITIFGPLLAVLYLGQNYLAFRDRERIDAIRSHFDALIRAAEYDSRAFPDLLKSLREQVA